MTQKKKNPKDNVEVTAECDIPRPLVTEAIDFIKNAIYTIRGVKVMLDADLAEIYGYSTKAFNQQVKNNIEKFDADFRFQLTKEEYHHILRSKNLTIEQHTSNSYSDDNTDDTILKSKILTSNKYTL